MKKYIFLVFLVFMLLLLIFGIYSKSTPQGEVKNLTISPMIKFLIFTFTIATVVSFTLGFKASCKEEKEDCYKTQQKNTLRYQEQRVDKIDALLEEIEKL